jgi:hypothetical protein
MKTTQIGSNELSGLDTICVATSSMPLLDLSRQPIFNPMVAGAALIRHRRSQSHPPDTFYQHISLSHAMQVARDGGLAQSVMVACTGDRLVKPCHCSSCWAYWVHGK